MSETTSQRRRRRFHPGCWYENDMTRPIVSIIQHKNDPSLKASSSFHLTLGKHLLAAFSLDIFIPVLSGCTLFYLDQFYNIPWVMTRYKLTRLTRKHTGKIDADCDTGSGETRDNDRIMPRVRVTKVAPGDIIETICKTKPETSLCGSYMLRLRETSATKFLFICCLQHGAKYSHEGGKNSCI